MQPTLLGSSRDRHLFDTSLLRCDALNTSLIFSDESSNSGQKFCVFGGIYFWCPNEECKDMVARLETEMNEIKAKYGVSTVKWEDVPRPSLKLEGYKALVEYLAKQKSRIKFKCMVVDTVAHPLKSKEYNDGDRQLGYLKYYTVFLTNGIMLAQRGYFYDITIDNYSFQEGSEYSSQHLGERVEGRYVRISNKRHLKRRHSQLKTANDEDSNLIQMADLYSGAVAFCWNGGMQRDSNTSIGRKELVAVIRKNYVGVALDKNSKPMGPFVIWKFTNSSNEQDGPSPTAPGNVINFP